MELKNGLYEQVISRIISDKINKIDDDKKHVFKEKIDVEESSFVISQYLLEVIKKSLSYINKEDKVAKQIDLANKIINLLESATGENSLSEHYISEDAEMLLALLDKINSKYAVATESSVVRPITSLSQSSLFTGSNNEPSLESELKKEILSSDRIDMLVSFIKWSGLRLISDELQEFTKNNKLRIITTSYMGATDYKAIEFLSKLPNTEIRISYDTKRTRLHAKAYMFYRDTGFSTAYIGSSNLSNAAISSGLEWNMKVTEQDSKDILKKFEATFEAYWHDKEFTNFSPEDVDILKGALIAERGGNYDTVEYRFDIQPYSYQREILEKLRAEREIHGKYNNLIVAATGTGKTVISAFDYKNFRRENSNRNRLLFIAHREEILKQSISTFRGILKDHNFGDLWVGSHEPEQIEHLFISIQTFNSKEFYKYTSPDYYDYIIVDEFHHSAAPSYQKLIEYYKPKILLGLTATPERMDGKDITEYFDGRIAAEIRLGEAIDRKLLSPFQYFGVTDVADLSSLKWTRGGYEKSELENLYTHNTRRSEIIVDSLNRYITDINEVIGLGFCVSIEHAKYMAEYFNQKGITSIALHGGSSEEERANAQKELIRKEIRFIFVVDLYNEGVDIPEINTILFMRPTESLTVFLQQLGRGLRLSFGKECLTVLDFIGQAHKKYNFEEKFRALTGKTHHSMQKEIVNGFPNMPKGCFIQLEKLSQKYILDNIKNYFSNKSSLVKKIETFVEDTGKELSLINFIEHYHLSMSDIYSRASWSRLCVEAGVKNNFINEDEKRLTKALLRALHINSRRWIETILKQLQQVKHMDENNLSEYEKKMLTMFHFTIWQNTLDIMGFNSLKDSLLRIYENRELYEELIEILEYNLKNIDFIDKEIELEFPCPLHLHCSYTRDEILAALGYYTLYKKPSQREGVLYLEDNKVDAFFITLNKSEKDYSPSTLYDDYAIDEALFHWQSQSTTSDTSKTGERYINHRKLGSKVLMFVREYKTEGGITSPYNYLGTANYVSHSGSRPLSVIWKLENEMPVTLLKKANKAIVG
jgi:superfamily II DNA or RNA helicase